MRAWILFLLVAIPAFAGREFVSGSSQLMVSTIDPVSPPITISVRAWARQDTASLVPLSIGTTTNASERIQIFFQGVLTNDILQYSAVDTTFTAGAANGSSSYSTNGWTHIVGVESSSTLRTLYVDGRPEATNTTAITVNGLNQVVVGSRKSSTFGAFFTGTISEVAIWNVALSASEIKQLSDGVDPRKIRPSSPLSLVFYAPLWGASTPEVELIRGYTISHTNAPASANGLHPTVYR